MPSTARPHGTDAMRTLTVIVTRCADGAKPTATSGWRAGPRRDMGQTLTPARCGISGRRATCALSRSTGTEARRQRGS